MSLVCPFLCLSSVNSRGVTSTCVATWWFKMTDIDFAEPRLISDTPIKKKKSVKHTTWQTMYWGKRPSICRSFEDNKRRGSVIYSQNFPVLRSQTLDCYFLTEGTMSYSCVEANLSCLHYWSKYYIRVPLCGLLSMGGGLPRLGNFRIMHTRTHKQGWCVLGGGYLILCA